MTTVAGVSPTGVDRSLRGGRSRRVAIAGGLAIASSAVLCGWAIYLDLHDLIGRTALCYALAFAFVPVVPLAAAFLWLDRVRPEPTRLLVVALLWGALGATAFALQVNSWLADAVGDQFGATARSAVFVAPWVEEAAKASVIFVIAFTRRQRFGGPLAGAVYGGLVGIGFAFTENIVYYGQLFQRVVVYQGSEHVAIRSVEHLFLWRGVAAPFVHPMFTMITGLGIGLSVQSRHRGVRLVAPLAGFLVAVLLHMGYNAAAIFSPGSALTAVYLAVLLPIVLALAAGLVWLRHRERRIIGARLVDCGTYGWIPSAAALMVATRTACRTARLQARSLGRAQVQELRGLQRAGFALGSLRDRMVRGVSDASDAELQQTLVLRFSALCDRLPATLPAGSEQPSAAGSFQRSAPGQVS